ncbi:MAG: class I SAM-dependent DNA methyltransferase [Spirochaetes bacterium]|nr:class I SAM-dependent DNA methyltransferase [Spirochaetota bacterium]
MPLSWNEIKHRAIEFSKEWEDSANERSEAQSFWRDFFNIFGISTRRVATFEEPVKKLGEKQGFIDLFWKGTLLIEHKSKGKDLDKAYEQALDYFPGIKEEELPRYIIVSDFENFRLYDLDENNHFDFELKELVKNVHHFGFIAGYIKKKYKEEDTVNIEAAELMGKLHDKLFKYGYQGHQLEILLVRLVFILFGDDTGIFEKNLFTDYIELKTNIDGSDLGSHLGLIFQTLNNPVEKRMKNIDEDLNKFPYVNGGLFKEQIMLPSFDKVMRDILLKACYFDWSKISPAIFGSMFQSVMDQEKRRNIGAHYTSEKNILKIVKSLFLDELYKEFKKVKSNKKQLEEFHNKLSKLKFLDPACGCGNFLIISYRELRLLELQVLKHLYTEKDSYLDFGTLFFSKIDVDQFYGIEIEEFPAKVAELALWLTDHQMNMLFSEEFGHYYARLPLLKSPTIINDNALRIDWDNLISNKELNYILGNPPFIGYKYQNKYQKKDLEYLFKGYKGAGVLDYVTAWYFKAAEYIEYTKIKVAYVSTNSIVQGEQVGIIWNILINKFNIYINFAHRTFKWSNEAKGNAAVHVVIIGFSCFDINDKRLFDYEDINGDPHEIKVKRISPYLVDAKNNFINKRTIPISKNIPCINYGNEPREGGFLIISDNKEKEDIINKYPSLKKYIKRFMSANDFINNIYRWCFWLVNAEPNIINKSKELLERIKNVKEFRLKSLQKQAFATANTPTLFTSIRQPKDNYLLIPIVSSENRKYIPIGYISPDVISSNACFTFSNAKIYHFGILTSIMHMAWIKYICGRLKSDFRYSNTLVYNNFPWPNDPDLSKYQKVEECAQKVLDIRKKYPDSSLADLYKPLTMPPDLVKAHQELDKTVDRCYRSQPFTNELNRIEFLFDLYEKYTKKE